MEDQAKYSDNEGMRIRSERQYNGSLEILNIIEKGLQKDMDAPLSKEMYPDYESMFMGIISTVKDFLNSFDDSLNSIPILNWIDVVSSGFTKALVNELKARFEDHEHYGDEENDTITGCSQKDTLYGGDGDDILRHAWGIGTKFDDMQRDFLAGGSGYDTYYVGTGDSVYDSDGSGRIFFNGFLLCGTATYNKSKNAYFSSDSIFKYTVSKVGFTVENLKTGDTLKVRAPNTDTSGDEEVYYSALDLTFIKKKYEEDEAKPEEPEDPSTPKPGAGDGACTGSTGCTCGTCKPPCTGTDDCDCGECSNKKETEADPVNPDGGTTTTAPAVRSPIIFDLDGDCMMARIAN